MCKYLVTIREAYVADQLRANMYGSYMSYGLSMDKYMFTIRRIRISYGRTCMDRKQFTDLTIHLCTLSVRAVNDLISSMLGIFPLRPSLDYMSTHPMLKLRCR